MDKKTSLIVILSLIILILLTIIISPFTTKKTLLDSTPSIVTSLEDPITAPDTLRYATPIPPEQSPATPSTQPVCNIRYKADESKVIYQEATALITSFEKECDGYYYFTFDYVGSGYDAPKGSEDTFYTNDNPKLRTFRMNPNLHVETLEHDKTTGLSKKVILNAYVRKLDKKSIEVFNRPDTISQDSSNDQSLIYITVTNGVVTAMKEV
jgi:hypothetical protein